MNPGRRWLSAPHFRRASVWHQALSLSDVEAETEAGREGQMTALHATDLGRARQPVRPLIIGLVCVLGAVGGVFTVQAIPRVEWTRQCSVAGGRVVSHAGGNEPYLAHGSVISYTCEGPDGQISSWP